MRKSYQSRFARARNGTAAILACAALFDATPAASQAAGEWRDPKHMYASSCQYCHDTGVSPVLRGRMLPVEYIIERVRKGFGPMPAFKPSELSDADLDALASWISTAAAPPSTTK
jgi:mono/diheme cytochrome c family protein